MTNEKLSLEFLKQRIALLTSGQSASESSAYILKTDDAEGTLPDMDITTYRLDQAEKRAEATDLRLAHIESQLTQIQIAIAGLATKDGIRNWGVGVIAIVVATAIGLGALLMQSSGNQLSAFQAGLAAV